MTADPPLVLDIDGTLTHPDAWRLDPRIFEPVISWDGPVVIATGKMFPIATALCQFIGIPEHVVAENGGIVYTGSTLDVTGDTEGSQTVLEEYEAAGYETGWPAEDTVNRWRETELIVQVDQPLEPLREIADHHGLEVVDTGYAYHVKSPAINKGLGVETMAAELDFSLAETVAIGDSKNDVSTFEVVGRSFAPANADAAAREAADEVVAKSHAPGTLSVLERIRNS